MIKYVDDSNTFIECLNNTVYIYERLKEYNPKKFHNIVVKFDNTATEKLAS